MGIEYRTTFKGATAETKDAILRAAPGFTQRVSGYHLYEYRSPGNTDVARMPDAYAAVEADGFYLCDNGGSDLILAIQGYLKAAIEATGQSFVLENL